MARGFLSKPVYFPELYVEKDGVALQRLKELRNAKVELLRNDMIALNRLNLSNEEFWNFLEGKKLRGRSRGILIFKKETTPAIAQLLGFIITDGSLASTEGRVKLCQRELDLIIEYIKIINNEYKCKLTYTFDGKEANVGSIPLRYILHRYYGIPLGKKVRIVEVPAQITSSNNEEILKSFIAGLFDGDGYVHHYHRKDSGIFDKVTFCISTSSHKLVEKSIEILDRLDIKCAKLIRRDDNRMTLQTSGFENSLKFYEKIIPYIFHKKRRETAEKIFNGEEFAEKFTIPLSSQLKDLFRKIRKNNLDKILVESGKYKYINSVRSIESWTYPSKFGKVRSIYVYRACKLLEINPNKYIPQNQLNFVEKSIQ